MKSSCWYGRNDEHEYFNETTARQLDCLAEVALNLIIQPKFEWYELHYVDRYMERLISEHKSSSKWYQNKNNISVRRIQSPKNQ